MKAISECPKCSNKTIDGFDNFCAQCGEDLRPYQHKFDCCGAVFLPRTEATYLFCPYCGSKQVEGVIS